MAIVNYKFEFDPTVLQFPQLIIFGGEVADLSSGHNNGVIQGIVREVPLEPDGTLRISVLIEGTATFSWSLTADYGGRKTVESPIVRVIPSGRVSRMNRTFQLI